MLKISVLDLIDIFLVAVILFQFYRLIRGTAAFSIFLGIFFIYLFWLIVKAMKMELISLILGQVIGVGAIALIIVFQQEIRRFLLVIGNRYISRSRSSFGNFFQSVENEISNPREAEEIVRASDSMAAKKIGALMVIGRKSRLDMYTEGGEIVNALISADLIETIFFKNSPLHDGAILIEDSKILAVRCPLPVTEQINLPPRYGMRHRAAIGISEHTDALVVVISEETGNISVADAGILTKVKGSKELREILLKERI